MSQASRLTLRVMKRVKKTVDEGSNEQAKVALNELEAAVGEEMKNETALNSQEMTDCTSLVKQTITRLETIICPFCGGWGHNLKQCGTYATLKKQGDVIPGFKAAWGKMKSSYLTSKFEAVVPNSLSRKRGRKEAMKSIKKYGEKYTDFTE